MLAAGPVICFSVRQIRKFEQSTESSFPRVQPPRSLTRLVLIDSSLQIMYPADACGDFRLTFAYTLASLFALEGSSVMHFSRLP